MVFSCFIQCFDTWCACFVSSKRHHHHIKSYLFIFFFFLLSLLMLLHDEAHTDVLRCYVHQMDPFVFRRINSHKIEREENIPKITSTSQCYRSQKCLTKVGCYGVCGKCSCCVGDKRVCLGTNNKILPFSGYGQISQSDTRNNKIFGCRHGNHIKTLLP